MISNFDQSRGRTGLDGASSANLEPKFSVKIKDLKVLRLLNLSDPFEQIVPDVFENVLK